MLEGYAEKELEYINRFANRKYKADEVYVFTVNLCDNDVDRDNEAFSVEALRELERLFVGKTGILEKSPSSKNRTARIFVCGVESVPGKKTKAGDDYYKLVARAFIPVNKNTVDTVSDIKNGRISEISIGCSVENRMCSICGKDIHICGHKKGEMYDGKLCYSKIFDIVDAYEWAAVANPTIRKKSKIRRLTPPESAIERLKRIKCNSSEQHKAVLMAISAIRLQYIEKEPLFGDDNGVDVYTCPECWCSIPHKYQSHCDHCGQRLNWWRYRT